MLFKKSLILGPERETGRLKCLSDNPKSPMEKVIGVLQIFEANGNTGM
jgi:hypothetical protein